MQLSTKALPTPFDRLTYAEIIRGEGFRVASAMSNGLCSRFDFCITEIMRESYFCT